MKRRAITPADILAAIAAYRAIYGGEPPGAVDIAARLGAYRQTCESPVYRQGVVRRMARDLLDSGKLQPEEFRLRGWRRREDKPA